MPKVKSKHDLVQHFVQNYHTDPVLYNAESSSQVFELAKERLAEEVIAEGEDKDRLYKHIESYADEIKSLVPQYYTISTERELQDHKEAQDPSSEYEDFNKEMTSQLNAIKKVFTGLFDFMSEEDKEERIADAYNKIDTIDSKINLKKLPPNLKDQIQALRDEVAEMVEAQEFQLDQQQKELKEKEAFTEDEIDQLIEVHDNMELFNDMAEEHKIRDDLK